MNKIWSYIAVFLLGGLIVALYALNAIKPNIIADSYIANLEQNVKKLKQSGDNNELDIKHTIDVSSDQPKQRKKFLGIIKCKNKKL